MVSWEQGITIRTPAERDTHLGKRLVGETFTQTMAQKCKR